MFSLSDFIYGKLIRCEALIPHPWIICVLWACWQPDMFHQAKTPVKELNRFPTPIFSHGQPRCGITLVPFLFRIHCCRPISIENCPKREETTGRGDISQTNAQRLKMTLLPRIMLSAVTSGLLQTRNEAVAHSSETVIIFFQNQEFKSRAHVIESWRHRVLASLHYGT